MSRRVLLTGGGTGGHITPLIAVAHELKQLDPGTHITYVGERNAKYASMTADTPYFDETSTIHAGKFRRYHGESLLRRLFDVRTNILNIRDLFYILFGTFQSLGVIGRVKPDIVLLKGGFVGVPVGIACILRGVPFITHDSDAIPGLANRLVSRWATYHATGLPAEYYSYDPKNIRYVGVLVGPQYQLVAPEMQASYKEQLGLPTSAQVLVVTGGSGGALAINRAVRSIIDELLVRHSGLYVYHQVGKGKTDIYDGYQHDRLRVVELFEDMHVYTGAADVVICRAGANTLAELGVQAKATIVIPNPLLTSGHQLKNAEVLANSNAAKIVSEADMTQNPHQLLGEVNALLENNDARLQLGRQLETMVKKDAARTLAYILINPESQL